MDSFAFNAYGLARLRDWYWLNSPSWRLGGGYQGYDLRGAITHTNGAYKEEEGNYGKLLRLWDSNFAPKPPMDAILERTEVDYGDFRYVALHSGFESLSCALLNSLPEEAELKPLVRDGMPFGFRRGPHWFVLNSKVSKADLIEEMTGAGVAHVFLFSDKYTWSHCKLSGAKLANVSVGQTKPKHLGAYLASDYVKHLGEG